MTAIPTIPGEITPEWLTVALREGGSLPEGRVSSVQVTAIGVGRGFVGQNLRIEATYEGGTGPPSFFAKLPTARVFEEADQMSRLYGMEIRFYRELQAETRMHVPRHYWSGYDTAAGRYFLLLEDLGHLTEKDQADACSIEEARIIVAALARMHAGWWNSPRLAELRWLPKPDASGMVWQFFYTSGWHLFAERFKAGMPKGFEDIGRRIGEQLTQIYVRGAVGAQTLMHGDFRLENFMFEYDSEGPQVTVLDWQLVAAGSGARDLAYFMGQSLTVEDRRGYERELLHVYIETLAASGVTGYGFERCYEDYRLGLLAGMLFPVNVARFLAQTEARAPGEESAEGARFSSAAAELAGLMAERNMAAIIETSAAELLSGG